ncbi:hypothetical protein BJ508DRAFT_351497 [Ascobolus immersus RN42]|uniref:Uncharacterized protein n=1 Tax=Ascobolus immersus RN42 TaxID=1160509 RepID=A0A3N4HRW4_ASCIM|nr:hypothetical protein BJ508DRAFT_351497 [Ascobolus immersus RN42]
MDYTTVYQSARLFPCGYADKPLPGSIKMLFNLPLDSFDPGIVIEHTKDPTMSWAPHLTTNDSQFLIHFRDKAGLPQTRTATSCLVNVMRFWDHLDEFARLIAEQWIEAEPSMRYRGQQLPSVFLPENREGRHVNYETIRSVMNRALNDRVHAGLMFLEQWQLVWVIVRLWWVEAREWLCAIKQMPKGEVDWLEAWRRFRRFHHRRKGYVQFFMLLRAESVVSRTLRYLDEDVARSRNTVHKSPVV